MFDERHGEHASLAPPLSLRDHLIALRNRHPRARVYRGERQASPQAWIDWLSTHDLPLLSHPASRIDAETLCLICLVRHGYGDLPAEFVAVWESEA